MNLSIRLIMDETTKLQTQYEKFCRLLTRSTGETADSATLLIESLGERLLLCPGSISESEEWSYPGGLMNFSMAVTKQMHAFSKVVENDLSQESIMRVGLLHAIGMVGGPLEGQDYLIPQDSDWHKKQGRLYRYNENLPKMPIAHRSLLILQAYGVKLSYDEWVAIATSSGPSREENKFYVGSEPKLSILLSTSRQWILSRQHN